MAVVHSRSQSPSVGSKCVLFSQTVKFLGLPSTHLRSEAVMGGFYEGAFRVGREGVRGKVGQVKQIPY